MTFVGKILVILIMLFSVVFLGISTVVFSTATNWKAKHTAQAADLQKAQGKMRDAEARANDAEAKRKAAFEERDAAAKQNELRLADLDKQVKEANGEMNAARGLLEVAQNNAKVSLTEATARKTEVETIAGELAKAQADANKFSSENIELRQQIRSLERQKASAEQNARSLRDLTGRMTAFLRQRGIPMENIDKLDPNSVPPPVEGKVTELNATRRTMEISIGSDDGLHPGQELYVFRIQPRAEYIGKVKIVSVYPDKAVAEVIGNTVNGKKVQENDIVSSTLLNTR